MTTFLDELKSRLAAAQKNLQTTQQELQATNIRFQSAAQEVSSLQLLVNIETAKLQPDSANPTHSVVSVPQPQVPQAVVEINKTDRVREVLRQHPGGITPSDIWKEVKGQMSHRAYLYSILKRLKERDEVTERRKKYFFKARIEESRGQNMVQ